MGKPRKFFNLIPFQKEFMNELISLLTVGELSIRANANEEGDLYIFVASYDNSFSIEEINFIAEKFKESNRINVFSSIELTEGEDEEIVEKERVVISVYYSPETLKTVLSPETIDMLKQLKQQQNE